MHHDQAFVLPVYYEYVATYLWATSGAVLAARRGYAVMGILTLAAVSATGGGLLRDGMLLQSGPPALLQTPIYLQLIALASLMVMLLGGRFSRWRYSHYGLGIVDAIGLGGYAAVGMRKALVAGLPYLGVVVVGMVNAVGGGILRDVLLNQPVSMFKPGPLEEAVALFGCLLFLLTHKYLGMAQIPATWLMIFSVFCLRLAAIHFNLCSRPVAAFAPYEQ